MQVEVVYASHGKQTVLKLDIAENLTIAQAIVLSGILELYPEIVGGGPCAAPDQPCAAPDQPCAALGVPVGIFGKLRSLDWLLKDGDRIEIYRSLLIDPKSARVKRAKAQRLKKIKLKIKNKSKTKT